MEVFYSTSGSQALDILKKSPPEELPKVIWLDYYLKDLNGIEFMQQIKKNPQLVGIPVIVVSNSASEEKVQKMTALGAKKYILKAQTRLDDIVTDIQKLVAATGETAPETNSPLSKKVLIVEDEPVQAIALTTKLTKEGLEVDIAKDGVEGLEMFGRGKYDLVLLDLLMPRMPGEEMLKKLQSSFDSLPPIVILTNKEGFVPPEGVSVILYKSNSSLERVAKVVKQQLNLVS